MGYKTFCNDIIFVLSYNDKKNHDIPINELRDMIYYAYELCLLHELRITVICTSYKLPIAYKVTSFCLLHKLRVIFCIRVTSYRLLRELQVTFWIRVTSYCLLHEL